MANNKKFYFFVDESGDPTFYNKYGKCIVGNEGCSKILLLGFIKTTKPKIIRKAIKKLHNEIAKDEYLKKIPSIKKTLKYFHAKDDCPEVREKVFKMIKTLDFKAEFCVARKKESIFKKKYKKEENIFYDDLIIKLFDGKLHKAKQNIIYFAVRGNTTRQKYLEAALQTAIISFESKCRKKVNSEIKIFPQMPSDEPCLQIIDYMNWAMQRAFIKNDDRYFKFIEEKVVFIADIYDFANIQKRKNLYWRKNKFDINKISPL